jgi:hypothetical protein
VFEIFNYHVSLSIFFVFYYIATTLDEVSLKKLHFLLLLIAVMIFNLILNIATVNWIEFIKSFILVGIFLYCYIFSCSTSARNNKIDYNYLVKACAFILGLFELLQVGQNIILKENSLWFIFDGVSISNATDIKRFSAVNLNGYYRPISFYHEPSYLAAIFFVLYAVNDVRIKSEIIKYILIFLIVLTLSATFVLMLSMYMLVDIFHKKRILFYKGFLLLMIPMLFWSSYLIDFFRIGEIAIEGSSGWYRFNMPFVETLKIVKSNWSGIPLGQINYQLDNSLFLIISYFGVFAIPLFVFLFLQIFRLSSVDGTVLALKYSVVGVSLLFLSGALFTPESAVLFILLNSAFFEEKSK